MKFLCQPSDLNQQPTDYSFSVLLKSFVWNTAAVLGVAIVPLLSAHGDIPVSCGFLPRSLVPVSCAFRISGISELPIVFGCVWWTVLSYLEQVPGHPQGDKKVIEVCRIECALCISWEIILWNILVRAAVHWVFSSDAGPHCDQAWLLHPLGEFPGSAWLGQMDTCLMKAL